MSEISRQEFQRRRQALVEQMQPGSAALIFAAPEVTRSADSEYPYRQNSDFWYFTGFNEPEAVLVLIKSDDTHNHSVLFNRVRDLTAEIWFGQLLNGLDVVYHAQGEYAYADEIVNSALEKLRKGSRQNLTAPATMIDWRPVVHEMRLFKSPEEIAVLRRAGEITAMAHTRAMEKCRPGMFEYHLEGEIHHEFNRRVANTKVTLAILPAPSRSTANSLRPSVKSTTLCWSLSKPACACIVRELPFWKSLVKWCASWLAAW